jgi:hypothetical protein
MFTRRKGDEEYGNQNIQDLRELNFNIQSNCCLFHIEVTTDILHYINRSISTYFDRLVYTNPSCWSIRSRTIASNERH